MIAVVEWIRITSYIFGSYTILFSAIAKNYIYELDVFDSGVNETNENWTILKKNIPAPKTMRYACTTCTTHLSRWNFKLWTTSARFCLKFHRCKLSSAVTVIKAPSFIRNSTWTTAASSSCRTCASTPGLPILYINTGQGKSRYENSTTTIVVNIIKAGHSKKSILLLIKPKSINYLLVQHCHAVKLKRPNILDRDLDSNHVPGSCPHVQIVYGVWRPLESSQQP